MSAKHTHFSFPCPAISSKSYIATNKCSEYTVHTFLPTRDYISHLCQGANKLKQSYYCYDCGEVPLYYGCNHANLEFHCLFLRQGT